MMQESPLLLEMATLEKLKEMSLDDLISLAKEIRTRIIEVMSTNGGHLGSNLGAVELTLALHTVFSSPIDKLIWDVSHQTYTHKILTGRQDRFSTVRKYKGLSGFAHPEESIHDPFYAGHAGAALPAALGLAKRRDLMGGDETIISIIGDATLTSGLSLEALNNIHRGIGRFLVVLNDNEMSISKNVGAITRILSRLLSNPTTNQFLHDVNGIVSKIPSLGPVLSRQGHKFTESMKHLVSPAAFFEQYHLSYVGPIDGHDLPTLIETMKALKEAPFPVILHVLTRKGNGMEEAEKDPALWHGAKPFNKETYKFLPQSTPLPTFPRVFGETVLKMAEEDPDIVVVTPAMSQGSCLDEMMKKFPDRCIDVGIAEGHAISFSGAIAWHRDKKKAKKVIASIYSTFLQRAFDNLFHDVCIQEIPLVIAIDRAGIAGADGITHNGIYDIGFLNAMPNMVICQPRSGQLLQELLHSAFDWQRPAAIRYPNLPTLNHNEGPIKRRALGKGDLLIEGKEVVLFALGHMAEVGEKVVARLKEQGISASLVDPVFIKPLDRSLLLKMAENHSQWITLEEHALSSGFGSCINDFVIKNGLYHLRVLNIGIEDLFVHHGSHRELSCELGLDDAAVHQKILSFLEANRK